LNGVSVARRTLEKPPAVITYPQEPSAAQWANDIFGAQTAEAKIRSGWLL
jgi:hypothetical protein